MIAFSLIFVRVFAFNADILSPILFVLPTNKTIGIVQSIEMTNATENETPVYEVRYTYHGPGGEQYEGESYTTGEPEREGRVMVEYVISAPSISRIEGMRRTIFGPFAIFAILFPLVGLGFLYSGLKRGLLANRLLSEGKVTYGKLVSTEMTNTRINNRPVMKLTFVFTSEDGTEWEATAKTHQPEKLQDNVEEPLIYDPNNPSIAVMLDNLPGSTKFDTSGKLVPTSLLKTMPNLILPFLTVAGITILLLASGFGL